MHVNNSNCMYYMSEKLNKRRNAINEEVVGLVCMEWSKAFDNLPYQ